MEITNNTPWDTEALTKLVEPLALHTTLESITFNNHQPQPGVKREDQLDIYIVSRPYYRPNGEPISELKIDLLSPKRAKAKLGPLSRLAYAQDLDPHEVALPTGVIGRIVHAIQTVKDAPNYRGDPWKLTTHFHSCNCKTSVLAPPIIRGDTRTKTRPSITLEDLERKLGWAEGEVEALEKKLEKATKKRDRLLSRVEKKRGSMNKPSQSVTGEGIEF